MSKNPSGLLSYCRLVRQLSVNTKVVYQERALIRTANCEVNLKNQITAQLKRINNKIIGLSQSLIWFLFV